MRRRYRHGYTIHRRSPDVPRLLMQITAVSAEYYKQKHSFEEENMKIGVAKEIKAYEYRVAAVPTAVTELTRRGHEVFVEHDAGKGSGYSDEDYEKAGAKNTRSSVRRMEQFGSDLQGEGDFPGRI